VPCLDNLPHRADIPAVGAPGGTLTVVPDPLPRRSPLARLTRWVGIVLVLAGLAVVGYVVWELYGTNIVAGRGQERMREEIVQAWDEGRDPAPTVSGEALVRIPRFGDDWVKPVLLGFDDATLARSVGRYPDGAAPGGIGNLVLAGHRVTRGEPFRRFLELRAGDRVIVETRRKVFTYELLADGDEVRVDFTTSWPLQPVPEPEAAGEEPTERLITLITCSEIFHTDDRNVVTGRLVDVSKRR
jgi:sortase A